MYIKTFSIARLPRIEFGEGSFALLPRLVARYGKRLLLVTGAHTLQQSSQWAWLQDALAVEGVEWAQLVVAEEPSPQLVDEAVARFKGKDFDLVVGIGGGSVLDAAKAIAGLLKPSNSVMDHLEGVGPELPYRGPATPFIATPTTAGTGSEATKNAVLSQQGAGGFKKSFRDEQLVPEYALIDPALLKPCPPELIAANGMDALTQLLESYVSTKANPFTDALALSGLNSVANHLLNWYQEGPDAEESQAHMAYAALLSGITLAQVGLGSVHGLAAPLGAFFPIPHGVACGTLVAQATRVNIEAMMAREPENIALKKYAELGRLFSGEQRLSDSQAYQALVNCLEDWTDQMALPPLGQFGIAAADVARIVANSRGSSMQTNPILLTDEELVQLVSTRL